MEEKPKPPEGAWDDPAFEDHCTCAEYDWPEVEDPYIWEIHEESVMQSMCPYCYMLSLWDI